MAANQGSIAVTDAASAFFGPAEKVDISIQNIGTASAFISWETPVVDSGVRLAPGESISTRQLTERWSAQMSQGIKAICDTGETTTLIWHA